MRKWCIYEVRNLINGKTYIGQHTYTGSDENPLIDKYSNHYRGSGKILKLAYKKYGFENFEISILCRRIMRQDTADSLEQFYIKKARDIGKAEYNIRPGGQLRGAGYRSPLVSKALSGRKRDPIAVAKARETHKRNIELGLVKTTKGQKRDESFKLKCRLNTIGRKLSEETKRKLSEVRKGIVFSEEHLIHLSEAHKGQNKGMHWYNNGIKNVRAYTCPSGYVEGMIIHEV